MHMDEAWVGACVRAHTYTHTLAHSNKCKHTSAKGLEFGTNSATNLCDLEQGTKPFCPSVALFVKCSLAWFLKIARKLGHQIEFSQGSLGLLPISFTKSPALEYELGGPEHFPVPKPMSPRMSLSTNNVGIYDFLPTSTIILNTRFLFLSSFFT